MNRVVVVGASLAGLAVVQGLRSEGYDGEVVVVGGEPHRPYDRPPLSKDLLLGIVEPHQVSLEAPDSDLRVEWRLGVHAVGLDTGRRAVLLDDDTEVDGDAVVIATGARARTLAETLGTAEAYAGVHTLRTLEDALALRADLQRGGRLVVVGGGFIGCEVAAAARRIGVEVDVVEAAPEPLALALGPEVGAALRGVHESHGVRVHTGLPVVGVSGGDRVERVHLADGRSLPADAVLVALGSVPEVGWLHDSGLEVDGGVRCDPYGLAAPGILAVGDCAAAYDPAEQRHRRLEHWTDARVRAGAVGRLLARPDEPAPPLPAPYVWSDQYDLRIQYAGRHRAEDRLVVESGSLATGDLLATYRRGDEMVAVLGVNQPREFGRRRRELNAAARHHATAPTS